MYNLFNSLREKFATKKFFAFFSFSLRSPQFKSTEIDKLWIWIRIKIFDRIRI